jgi:WD40 repeat protein
VEAGRYGVTLEDGQEPIRRYCERVLHEGHGERWYARRNAVAHFLSSKKFWPKVEAYLTDLDFIAERFESKEATLLLRDLDEAVERFSKADEIENASEKSLREWSQEVLAFPSHAITREGASIPRPPGAHALASERQIKELRQATPTRFDRLKELQGFLHMQVGAIERTSSNRRKSFIAQQMSNLSRSGHLHGMAARHLRDCKQPLLRRAGSGGSDRYNGQDPCIGTFRLESRAEALAWRPETDCLAIGHENGDLRIFRPGQLHSDTVLRCEPDKKTGRRRKALCVDISWDRKKAVVGHSDGTVRVWDLENQTCCWSFKHNHEVVDADEAENPEVEGSKRKKRDLHARISPDGRRLLTAGDDGKVCIWDISTCEARWASPESDFAHGLAWSADGRRVVYGRADGGIACWDEALQERFILPGDGSEVRDLVLSFDGGVCVTGQKNGKVAIWDMERRRCSSRLDADLVGPIYAVAITADGARFAAGGKDKRIRVWRSADQKLERVLFGSLFPVHCLAMHPLGHQIISGGRENFLRIWDLSNRNSLDVDASDGAEFKSLMRSSDRRFAIAYDEHGRFHKWRLADLKRVGELQKIGQGQAAEFFRAAPLPRSREICVVGVDKSIRIVDENDGRVKLQFPATVSGKKFAAASTLDEKTLIVSSGDRQSRISLWDKRRGVQLSSSAKPIGLVRALVVLPDGRRFVSVSEDRAIRFWSLGDPEPQSIIKDAHDSHIHWAACSPDGRLLATAGRDRVLSLWSTETQQRLWTDGGGHQGALFWVEFSASGQYLWSACWNGLVQIWDVGARRVLTSAWLPGVSRLMLFNRGRSAIIGTSIGHIDRFDASGLEDKPVIATALRSNKPFHGASALFTCNECGKQSSVSRKIFDRISQWESGTSDEGYNDPLLVTSCKKCGSKTRMNPFFASPGIECP